MAKIIRLAPPFLEQAHVFNRHFLIDSLTHIIYGKGGHRHGRSTLPSSPPGLTLNLDLRIDANTSRRLVDGYSHVDNNLSAADTERYKGRKFLLAAIIPASRED